MRLQPSASRTELLLACPRPFGLDVEVEADAPGEPARYGSAFHQVIAACLRSPAKKTLEQTAAYARAVDKAAKSYDVRRAADELAGHVKSSVKVLRNWLEREKLEVVSVEEAYAVHPRPDGEWKARMILPHDEDHQYTVEVNDIPGTVDLIAESKNKSRSVVIDHKTGGGDNDSFAQPVTIPQMQTLGLVADSPNVEVGIFHADRRGLPAMYVDPYEGSLRRTHAKALYRALGLVDSGFLRPGPHCNRCPAKVGCPAHTADLLAESSAALVSGANKLAVEPMTGLLAPETGASLEVRAGALYELLKKFRKLEKAGSEEIRRLVKAGAVIETREGKVLAIQEQTYEVLSKKSVIEALGKVAGEKVLAKLRAQGAIREAKREMLVGEK